MLLQELLNDFRDPKVHGLQVAQISSSKFELNNYTVSIEINIVVEARVEHRESKNLLIEL